MSKITPPNYSEGIALLNLFHQHSKRSLIEIAAPELADFKLLRLQKIMAGQCVDITHDELVRLCVFGVSADFESTNEILGLFNFPTLAQRSRSSQRSESGLKRLQSYHERSKERQRTICDWAGVDESLFSMILHDKRPVTRPVLIRLCGWGFQRNLAETNATLLDYDFMPLSEMRDW